MTLPLFPPADRPGPDFIGLLRRLGHQPMGPETEGAGESGYEETDFHADGSGGRDARTTIKLGWEEDLDRHAAIELAVLALYEAADEDSATGGPDIVRGIYPTVATITGEGYQSVAEAEVAER